MKAMAGKTLNEKRVNLDLFLLADIFESRVADRRHITVTVFFYVQYTMNMT